MGYLAILHSLSSLQHTVIEVEPAVSDFLDHIDADKGIMHIGVAFGSGAEDLHSHKREGKS